jgi:hypothetical protein
MKITKVLPNAPIGPAGRHGLAPHNPKITHNTKINQNHVPAGMTKSSGDVEQRTAKA